jgi:hypothetical protein
MPRLREGHYTRERKMIVISASLKMALNSNNAPMTIEKSRQRLPGKNTSSSGIDTYKGERDGPKHGALACIRMLAPETTADHNPSPN